MSSENGSKWQSFFSKAAKQEHNPDKTTDQESEKSNKGKLVDKIYGDQLANKVNDPQEPRPSSAVINEPADFEKEASRQADFQISSDAEPEKEQETDKEFDLEDHIDKLAEEQEYQSFAEEMDLVQSKENEHEGR